MLDTIALILMSIITVGLIGLAVFFRYKYRKMIAVIAQLILDKEVIASKLDDEILLRSKEVNEGFIKFLSDSREAAFGYIENVQSSIQNYLVAIEKGTNDEIVTARMELFSHLPDQPEDENKNEG